MRTFLPCLVVVTLIAAPAFAQTPRASAPATPAGAFETSPELPAPDQQPSTPPPSRPTATAPTPTPQSGRPGQAPGAMNGMDGARQNNTLPALAVNVKLDLAITDTYGGTPSKKVVTLLVANGGNGMVRTANRLSDGSPVNLNVDALVHVYANGVVMLGLTFQYTPAQSERAVAQGSGTFIPRPADLNESVNVILQDGKPTIVSESADPATDRKVTAEVTATIIK